MAKARECECAGCRQFLARPCDGPVTFDPHTRLWLCNGCWFHTDPGRNPPDRRRA